MDFCTVCTFSPLPWQAQPYSRKAPHRNSLPFPWGPAQAGAVWESSFVLLFLSEPLMSAPFVAPCAFMVGKLFHCHFFFLKIAPVPSYEFVKVHLMAVKLRPVNADKPVFSAYRYPACPAHACAVHHYRIYTYNRMDFMRP